MTDTSTQPAKKTLSVDGLTLGDRANAQPTARRPAHQPNQDRSCVRDATIAMLVAALVLLVFNSKGLRSWLRDLPGSATTDVLVNRADQWHRLMGKIGFTAPRATLQNMMSEFRETNWTQSLKAIDFVEAAAKDRDKTNSCEQHHAGCATSSNGRRNQH